MLPLLRYAAPSRHRFDPQPLWLCLSPPPHPVPDPSPATVSPTPRGEYQWPVIYTSPRASWRFSTDLLAKGPPIPPSCYPFYRIKINMVLKYGCAPPPPPRPQVVFIPSSLSLPFIPGLSPRLISLQALAYLIKEPVLLIGTRLLKSYGRQASTPLQRPVCGNIVWRPALIHQAGYSRFPSHSHS